MVGVVDPHVSWQSSSGTDVGASLGAGFPRWSGVLCRVFGGELGVGFGYVAHGSYLRNQDHHAGPTWRRCLLGSDH